MSLNSRVSNLEKTLETHLIESGEIRSDLKWLKRAFWTLSGAALTFNTVVAGYFINHLISK